MTAILEGLPRQQGRIALITGANGDLGLAMATQLAHRGSRLVYAVRDTARGEVARSSVLSRFPDADITLLRLDLSSLESVREFSQAYRERFERLDSLFLHAGLMAVERRTTSRAENWALAGLVPLLGQGAQRGALAMIRAGLSPRARGGDLWGPHWFHTRGEPVVRSLPRASRDVEAQERLWRLSEELTGVEFRLER